MKTVALQLITVHLENGEQGVFIGGPLVNDTDLTDDNQIDDIWFSDIQEVSREMTVAQLLDLVCKQHCLREATLQ